MFNEFVDIEFLCYDELIDWYCWMVEIYMRLGNCECVMELLRIVKEKLDGIEVKDIMVIKRGVY